MNINAQNALRNPISFEDRDELFSMLNGSFGVVRS